MALERQKIALGCLTVSKVKPLTLGCSFYHWKNCETILKNRNKPTVLWALKVQFHISQPVLLYSLLFSPLMSCPVLSYPVRWIFEQFFLSPERSKPITGEREQATWTMENSLEPVVLYGTSSPELKLLFSRHHNAHLEPAALVNLFLWLASSLATCCHFASKVWWKFQLRSLKFKTDCLSTLCEAWPN